MDAFALLCRTEGIIPAIESAHAIAGALRLGRELGPDGVVLVNLSGRGDKDVDTAAKWFGMIGRGESAEDASGTAIAEASLEGAGTAAPEHRPSGARPGCRRMTGVEEIFRDCRAQGRGALIGYLPAGYPTVDRSVELLAALVDGRLRPARGRRAVLRSR